MRKQNTNKTVPLDAVPERRTERCSPRFRPGGRFCELRFRYQSSPTGSEGEISRPLDHMWQIPFIHSTRLILVAISIYITQRSSYFLHVVHSSVSWFGAYLTFTHALLKKHPFQGSELWFNMLCAGAYELVSFAVVFRDVTQRPPKETGERCVTSRKTAAKETTYEQDKEHFRIRIF